MKLIDLRSDTVTQPTPEMRQAMFEAPLGDDVFNEDPSVNALQTYAAEMFGMEEALFCSSGTQTNQIGIKLHTQPGDEVICDALAHVYLYEGGGIAFNSGASVRLINSERGMFTAEDVLRNINDDNVHFPSTKLVCVENTVNKGGGACWNFDELKAIRAVCQKHNLAFHLDGARLFNALVAKNEDPKQYGQLFDTISICLSKGLGAPVGSLLLGSKQHIYKARRLRKVMGGGMRQAGILASAGLFALKNNIERLTEDHLKAKMIADVLQDRDWVVRILPVETNIVIFELVSHISPSVFMNYLESKGFKVSSMGSHLIRFVFHLDQNIEDIERLCEVLLAFQSDQSN
ncbi:MAG: threonine aldolase family protein [Chitinophagaceae bacterium]